MHPSGNFRHTRRAFAEEGGSGSLTNSLISAPSNDQRQRHEESELIDFLPPALLSLDIECGSGLLSTISRELLDCAGSPPAPITAIRQDSVGHHQDLLMRMREFASVANVDDTGLLDVLAEKSDENVICDRQPEPELLEELSLPDIGRRSLSVHIENLPGGGRVESFSNGSMLTKDGLGRVVEVRSTYGDCLFLEYGAFGHLEAFARTDARGLTHSCGRQDKHGIAVRDAEGRVRAAGESMTITPIGSFYLHTLDGQYFCLDLVAGMQAERRRIFQTDGSVDFLTAIFAHDGFRMASMYAVSGGKNSRYRFYGRDGTIVEFLSEDDMKCCRPKTVCGPGSKPVHKSWLKKPQACTAWESVFEYLSILRR